MLKHALSAVLWTALMLLVWEGLVLALEIPAYFLPSPFAVAKTLWFQADYFLVHATSTLAAALSGLLIALAIGSTAALLFSRYGWLGHVGEPLIGAAQTVPILAIAPILTAWFGPGDEAKIAAGAIVALPSITTTLARGLTEARLDEVDLFRSMGATPWQLIWYLRIPRALPFLFVAIRVAVPLSLLGAVVGEFVGAESGLGVAILRASYYLRTTEMLAAVLLLCVASLVLIWILEMLRSKTMRED